MKQLTVATLKLFGDHSALDFTNTVIRVASVSGRTCCRATTTCWTGGGNSACSTRPRWRPYAACPPSGAKPRWARAKVLREALYRIFATRPSADPLDLNLLQSEVRAAQEARMLLPDADGYAWRWLADDPDTATHRIALVAADLLTSSALDRVHICPGENCTWLFLDNSRAVRRLWCSEETCGMRSRVRRWRALRRRYTRPLD